MLFDDYKIITREIAFLGFNDCKLGLVMEVAKPQQDIKDEEKLINDE